jgi:hypothetical protein
VSELHVCNHMQLGGKSLTISSTCRLDRPASCSHVT